MNVSLRRVRHVALLAAVGGSMMLGAYAASAAPAAHVAGAAAAAPPPNASATVDTNLRVTGLDGPNRLTISQVPGQNAFLVTDTAPITALPGCGVVSVPNGLFGVQCRALVGSGEYPVPDDLRQPRWRRRRRDQQRPGADALGRRSG